jgi:hypothetical protein
MTELAWDEVGTREYETGVDHGVLYIPDEGGAYDDGVAWNGLVTITESPSGAEASDQYADNIKYLSLRSAEQFGATIEAYTYPDEFLQFDGVAQPVPGVNVGQQNRRSFGLSYRTKIGNDVAGDDFGYKLHLVYGATASPSEKAYGTINDSPEAITFSWEVSTVPVSAGPDLKPTSILTIDSTQVDAAALAALETILYGTVGVDPALPAPATVIAMFTGAITPVTPTQPAFDQPTNTITIPTVAGVTYFINGVAVPAGPVTITQDTIVEARPNAGNVFTPGVDDDWFYNFV